MVGNIVDVDEVLAGVEVSASVATVFRWILRVAVELWAWTVEREDLRDDTTTGRTLCLCLLVL